MSHFVTGLIAKASTLETLARERGLHQPASLTQGLSMLPLREQDFQCLTEEPTSFFNGFNHWSEPLSNRLAEWSKYGAIVYFETEYWGGTGGQAAAAYDGGSLVFGPKSSQRIGPINEALRFLGVAIAPGARDEFEAIGLKRYRHTEEWLPDARGTDT